MAKPIDARKALASVDPMLRQLANRLATPQAPAEDLWQEARLALIRALPRYDPACGRLTTFASVYGRAAMVRYLRDRTALIRKPSWRWEQGDREDDCAASLGRKRRETPAEDPCAAVESEIYVDGLLQQLRPAWRVVLQMRIDGWTDAEIGASLGISAVAVWRRRKLAAQRLRRLMDI